MEQQFYLTDEDHVQIQRLLIEAGNSFHHSAKKAKDYLKNFDRVLEEKIDDFSGLTLTVELMEGTEKSINDYGESVKAKFYEMQTYLHEKKFQDLYEALQKVTQEIEDKTNGLTQEMKTNFSKIESELKSKNLWATVEAAARKPGFNKTFLAMALRSITQEHFDWQIQDLGFLEYMIKLFGNLCNTCLIAIPSEEREEQREIKNCKTCLVSEDLNISSESEDLNISSESEVSEMISDKFSDVDDME